MEKIVCSDCQNPKDEDQFELFFSKKANRFYRRKYCYDCFNTRQRKRNKLKGNQHRYDQNLFYKYGIDRLCWEMMLSAQGHKCLGCQRDFSDDLKPCVDHCHASDKVRGLLCSNCNTTLGYVRDEPDTLRRLATYLERGA